MVIDVLANDLDPDTRIDPPLPIFPPSAFSELIYDPTPADVPDTKSIDSVNLSGLQGTVTVAADGKSLTYNPGGTLLTLLLGQSAVETFAYTMRDGLGLQSTATVTVTTTGTNSAPAAAAVRSATATKVGEPVSINVMADVNNPFVASVGSISLGHPRALVGDRLESLRIVLAALNRSSQFGSCPLSGFDLCDGNY